MTKYCSKCGKDNVDNSKFCRNCGKKLSGINSTNSNDSFTNRNNKILIGVIIALLIVVAIVGTYAYVTMNNDNSYTSVNSSIGNSSNSSVGDVNTTNESIDSDSYSANSEKTNQNRGSSSYLNYDPNNYIFDAYGEKMYWVENDGVDGCYLHPEETYGPISS